MTLPDITNAFPLSAVQQGMLYHCLEAGNDRAYVSHITFTITGALDLDAWKDTWHRTLQRHDSLRASFVWDGLDEPLQLINANAEPQWTISDLRELDPDSKTHRIRACIRHESHTGVSVVSAPLMRFSMLQVSNTEWRVIWSIHHLLADGWSTPLILQDVLSGYRNASALRTPAPSYADYIAWQTSNDTADAEHWWQQALAGTVATPLNLPRPTTATDGTIVPHVNHALTATETSLTLDFCKQHQITPGTLVHTAWALTIAAFADADTAVFGTTVSGRHPAMINSETTVGLFLTTLPLSININHEQSVTEFMQGLQLTLASCNQFDSVSPTSLDRLIDSSNSSTAFESIVVIESHSNDLTFSDPAHDLTLSNIEYTTHSHYPLALLAYPGNSIEFKLVYDASTVADGSSRQLLDHFIATIRKLTNADGLTIGDLLSVDKAVHSARYDPLLKQPPLHQWIGQVAATQPDTRAIVCSEHSISYRELDDQSSRLASYIQHNAGFPPTGIGIYIPRSISQIVAIVGILKSGHYYVPLDTGAPHNRTEALGKAADLKFILQVAEHPAPPLDNVTVLDLDLATDFPPRQTDCQPMAAGSLAYVMFTSGSSGTAKGVAVTHQNLTYSTAARLNYYGDQPCTFLLLSAISFDSSVAGIYWALVSGGTLVLPKPAEEKELTVLANYIADHRVTHTLCLPSLYSLLLTHTQTNLLATLTTVVVAGESCTPSLVSQHFHTLPDVPLYNEYGPTEATVWSTVHRITTNDIDAVPIGHEIPGTTVQIINNTGSICPDGAVGEIEISGPGVSAGYINATGHSNDNPFSTSDEADAPALRYKTGDLAYRNSQGQLMYLGRKDRQLKIRGHRIEPSEIENILLSQPEITEAIVIATQKLGKNASDSAIDQALQRLPADVSADLLRTAEQLPVDPCRPTGIGDR